MQVFTLCDVTLRTLVIILRQSKQQGREMNKATVNACTFNYITMKTRYFYTI